MSKISKPIESRNCAHLNYTNLQLYNSECDGLSQKYNLFPCLLRTFLAQSVQIKLALPQAAQLSIFYRKISSEAPPRGT